MKKFFIGMISFMMILMNLGHIKAVSYDQIADGTYNIDASLSCFIPAMGGIEFGESLLKSAVYSVKGNNRTITLYLQKSQVTIYGVTCDTFIDICKGSNEESNGVVKGSIGYYEKNGILNTSDIRYTLSNDTALNSSSEDVHYVDSITFPVHYQSSQYELTLCVNSNVMGTQFETNGYQALLSVDWDSIVYEDHSSDESVTQKDDNTSDITNNDSSDIEDKTDVEEHVEEMDGLNIHIVEDENNDSKVYVYLNEDMIKILGISSAGVLLLGIIIVLMNRKGE